MMTFLLILIPLASIAVLGYIVFTAPEARDN
jgi:hypothetical protein